jgi:hypothetical protein
VLALRYLAPGVFLTSAIVGALAGHLALGLAYLGLAVFYFLRRGPLALRRQAHRAEAALAANADPGPVARQQDDAGGPPCLDSDPKAVPGQARPAHAAGVPAGTRGRLTTAARA